MFDDHPAIFESQAVRSWPDLAAVIDAVPESPFASRPVVSVSFALNYALHGLDVTGYRVVNIALHLLCGLLVFGVVRRTLDRLAPGDGVPHANLAFVAALLWIVHPLNSEVVNYLTQRTESMMALFYLLTFYAAIRSLDAARPGTWQAAAVGACALGMACKESMVTAPVMLVLYERIFVFGSFREAFRARWRLYAGLVGTYVILALSMWSTPRTSSTGFANADTSVWHYLLNQTVMITRYLRLTVWPDSLVLYYGWNHATSLTAVWPYATFLVALFATSVAALVRRPVLGFVGAWFFITLAPTSSLVPIASEVGAERRMYLPVIALIVLAVVAGWRVVRTLEDRWAGRRRPGIVRALPALLVLGLSIALGATTIARTREYESSLTMARTVVARWPTPVARQMVGVELVNAGLNDEALPYLRDATADMPSAHLEYGTALFNLGRLDEAIEQFEAFLRLEAHSPFVARARLALGRALARQGRVSEAIEQLELALEEEPGNMEARGLLADALFSQQAFEPAIRYYREFLAAVPNHAGAIANLAIALAAIGETDAALEQFRRGADVDPANPEAHMNLALALIEHERFDEATEHARRAAELAPALPAPHDLYGRLLARQGKVDEAIAEFEQVLRLDPGNVAAREALRLLRGR